LPRASDVGGDLVASVADEPRLEPGINAVGLTYDFALLPDSAKVMTTPGLAGAPVNRFLAINRSREDLLDKLEAVRLTCQYGGCTQRYLTHDAFNGLWEATWRITQRTGGESHDRLKAYISHAQANDLAIGIAMTDGKGDRSKRPSEQAEPLSYVHVRERRADGIVSSQALQGHRYRRAVHARIPRAAVPPRWPRRPGLRSCLRRADRCAGRHSGVATRRPPGQRGGQVQRQVRAVGQARPFRRCLRAVGQGFHRWRDRRSPSDDHQLRLAPPP